MFSYLFWPGFESASTINCLMEVWDEVSLVFKVSLFSRMSILKPSWSQFRFYGHHCFYEFPNMANSLLSLFWWLIKILQYLHMEDINFCRFRLLVKYFHTSDKKRLDYFCFCSVGSILALIEVFWLLILLFWCACLLTAEKEHHQRN